MSDLAAAYNPADPDPWLAMELDQTLPFAPIAKQALMKDMGSASRQWILPFVRPVARLMIVFVQIFRAISPRVPVAPKFLHRLIAWGMKRFLSPEANLLILRHFQLGSEILGF